MRTTDGEISGSEEPRLWTRPLRELTPETSLGFACARFAADVLGIKLDAWQRWWLIHALELNPDGSFRFRTLLLLIARQNGKTEIVKALSLWLMFTGRAELVVASAQNLRVARLAWESACKLARNVPEGLGVQVQKVRSDNNDPHLLLTNDAKYMIAASTEDAARGIPGVDLLVLDELRTHKDSRAWAALTATTSAKPNALTVAMSNAGSDESEVLNALREAALAGSDPTLFLAEYSAPDGCDLDDEAAIAQANPSLGHGRLTMRVIMSALALDPPGVYRTERLCQRVQQLHGAVDRRAWDGCADADGTMDGLRDRLHLCLDVAEGDRGEHATLAVAALRDDGVAVVEVVEAWDSYAAMEAELPDLIERVDAAGHPWFFPTGPAAARADWLRKLRFQEIKGVHVTESCMAMAADVRAGKILHRDDALLTAHLCGAERLPTGDGWRFTRKGAGNVDAAYAGAGAVWAARRSGGNYATRDSLLWDHADADSGH